MLVGRTRRGREEEVAATAAGRRGAGMGEGHEEGELELEEGEAVRGDAYAYGYGGSEPGDDEFVDPNALTYIDEKLQNVLGHFQKDFEGGVLAENLGSQYGGYGSFLPTYQRSPSVLSQSRSPAVPPNRGSASRSPYMPAESAQKNNFVKAALDSRRKNDYCQRTFSGIDGNPPQQMLNRAVNGPEQKAPKIRIKVNNNKSFARNTAAIYRGRNTAAIYSGRNTAAIYSGLGLDISPSSSMDDSLDGSTGAPELKHLPHESPNTIFEIMTCYSVPGGLLLSPLSENVLELRKKSTPVTKKHEVPAFDDEKEELNRNWCHKTSAVLDNKNQMEKKIKYDEKKDHIPNFKSSKCRHNNTTILNKGIKPELQHISDDTDSILLPRSIKTEQHSVEESAKFVAEISDHLKETKNDPLKGQISDKSSSREMESMVDVKAVNLANDGKHPKGKANAKACTVRNAFEDWGKDSKTEPSLDHGFLGKIKYDSDEYNDQTFITSNHLQNVPPSKTSLEREKGKVMHVNGELSQHKSKEMGSLVNPEYINIITENAGGNPSGMPKGKKKTSSLQPALSGKRLKVKPHKQLNNDITRKSYGEDKSVKPEQETITSGKTVKDMSGGGNDGDCKISSMFIDKSAPMPSACKNESTESSMAMAVPAPAPVVIKEQWVCCDNCEKWRLLPYGMNPDILPKKWRCSMQSWLPRMSSCKISEDETTKAFRALYMVPAPENNISLDGRQDIATSGIGTVMTPAFEGNVKSSTTSGKLKVQSNDVANVSNNSNMAEMPKPSKKLHASTSGNPDDADCFPKLKEKRKHVGSSDKGETYATDQTHPKSKSSAEVDHDNLRASKKMKKGLSEPAKRHPPFGFEISKSIPLNKETPKNFHKHSGISLGMGKYGSSSSAKWFHDEDKVSSDRGIRISDAGRSDIPDLSIKNKKSKQMQLSQRGPDPLACDASAKDVVKEALSESNAAKEKPSPQFSKTDGHRKVAHARGPIAGIDSDGIYAEKERLSEQHQQNIHFQHLLLSENSMRDICYVQASAGATSSSSKVSSSHKSKADFQETRASPVESVSSSPLRTSDKNLLDQHRSYSRAVAENMHSQESGKSGSSCSKAHVSGCFNGDMHHHVLKDGDLHKDKQDLLTNECLKNEDSGRNGQLNPVMGQKVDSHVLSIHDNSDHKQPPSHRNGKTLPHFNSNQSDHAELTSGKHPNQVKPDKGNVEYKDLKINPSTAKGSKQQPSLNNTADGDASYKAKQSENAVIENMKQVTLNGDASSPINVSVLLKEARHLKHVSKRLKDEGDDLESASMCFEAGLKFLHVASLWEAPNIDSSNLGDYIQVMKLYSETGNLCGFCAREFERLKKMANAAMAYKCVEVAYMKAAFYKHPGATKDRHALQAASLMAPPAESPSSSASDVDNLNNQSTAANAVSARGVYSPQIASNPISRNNHHLAGLLNYVDNINCAFDGTRKSQSSFSAYLVSIGKDQVDGIALVREVLNFSFHNVKGLLQLIRHSLESINHEGVK